MYTDRKLFYVNRRSQIKVPASGGHFEEKSAQLSRKIRLPMERLRSVQWQSDLSYSISHSLKFCHPERSRIQYGVVEGS